MLPRETLKYGTTVKDKTTGETLRIDQVLAYPDTVSCFDKDWNRSIRHAENLVKLGV